MNNVLYKLFYGKPEYNKRLKASVYKIYRRHLRAIWNNEGHHDTGLEKIVRLFLVSVQFIFPGIHIRQFSVRWGVITRNLFIEFYVLFKTVLPVIFLASGLYVHKWTVAISAYLLFESVCYVAALIFVSDMFVRPRSYRRNILMLFLNYLELSFSYAVIYGGLHLLGNKPTSAVDYIYFSIITATTIGYGDFMPVGHLGKMVVCMQAITVVAFVVLFLNFFGSKVEVIHKEDE